jgi:hypothetical protein
MLVGKGRMRNKRKVFVSGRKGRRGVNLKKCQVFFIIGIA